MLFPKLGPQLSPAGSGAEQHCGPCPLRIVTPGKTESGPGAGHPSQTGGSKSCWVKLRFSSCIQLVELSKVC